jgi:hypothetical protein
MWWVCTSQRNRLCLLCQIRNHLDYIHLHILSVVTSTQLSRAFQRRSNFDLTRLLEGEVARHTVFWGALTPAGTENFLHKLIDRCQDDFSYFTSTLQPLRMAPALRDTAAAALMPPSKFKVGVAVTWTVAHD